MKRFTACLIISLILSSAAYAQATVNGHPADFDQYPSFLQVSTHMPNNGEAILRCGYSQTGATILPDAGYMESSVINPLNNGYARYQRIDNKIVITAPAPVPGHFLVQITEPNGIVAAKNCMMDLNTDMLSSCTNAQAFISAADANKQDQGAAQQCGDLFNKAMPQMDKVSFNQQKTDQFKASLRQKVAILEAP